MKPALYLDRQDARIVIYATIVLSSLTITVCGLALVLERETTSISIGSSHASLD